jgi:hypothetical protein
MVVFNEYFKNNWIAISPLYLLIHITIIFKYKINKELTSKLFYNNEDAGAIAPFWFYTKFSSLIKELPSWIFYLCYYYALALNDAYDS